MYRNMLGSLTVVLTAIALTACSTAPKSPAEREALISDAERTREMFLEQDPSLQELFDESAAHAVFPSIGTGGAGVGGSYGRGVVFQDGEAIGFCDSTAGSIGFQLGGQAFSQLIVFRDDRALDRFKRGNLEFDAQATAVAATAGAAADADYESGVVTFTMGQAGLMYQASIGGQSFDFEPITR